MATRINVLGDTIKIGKAFVSGKDWIPVNGDVVERHWAASTGVRMRSIR
jgi:hypothetical protein